MPVELKHVMGFLRGQALPLFTEEFATNQEELARGDIKDFYNAALGLISGAHNELCGFLGVADFGHFTQEVVEKIWFNTLKEMNGALPASHPYILCLVKQSDEPIDFMALYRERDPILAESLSRNIVPIKTLQEDEDLESGGKMEYIFPPDSLRSDSF